MNWIGLKHMVLYRIEQFLHLFISCRHNWIHNIKRDNPDPEGVHMLHCTRCDKMIVFRTSVQGVDWDNQWPFGPPAQDPQHPMAPVERKLPESDNFHSHIV